LGTQQLIIGICFILGGLDLRAIYFEIVASLKISREISTQCPDINWLTEKLKAVRIRDLISPFSSTNSDYFFCSF
jgi:hypothetical protein